MLNLIFDSELEVEITVPRVNGTLKLSNAMFEKVTFLLAPKKKPLATSEKTRIEPVEGSGPVPLNRIFLRFEW